MKKFTGFLNHMDRTKWLILGLGGILLLVIALPADGTGSGQDAALKQLQEADGQEDAAENYEKKMVSQLEETLRCMEGAGEVRVMITFQDSGENIVEKDISRSENENSSTQFQESAVYEETDGRQPYVSQQKLPAVEGVLVIAQGGGDSAVKQDILDAVMALFPIEAHKIKIVKMQNES